MSAYVTGAVCFKYYIGDKNRKARNTAFEIQNDRIRLVPSADLHTTILVALCWTCDNRATAIGLNADGEPVCAECANRHKYTVSKTTTLEILNPDLGSPTDICQLPKTVDLNIDDRAWRAAQALDVEDPEPEDQKPESETVDDISWRANTALDD